MCHPFGSLLYLLLLQLVSVLFRPSQKHWQQHPELLFSFRRTCHWFGSLQLVQVQMFSLFHQLHLGLLLVQVQLLSLFHKQHLLLLKMIIFNQFMYKYPLWWTQLYLVFWDYIYISLSMRQWQNRLRICLASIWSVPGVNTKSISLKSKILLKQNTTFKQIKTQLIILRQLIRILNK